MAACHQLVAQPKGLDKRTMEHKAHLFVGFLVYVAGSLSEFFFGPICMGTKN